MGLEGLLCGGGGVFEGGGLIEYIFEIFLRNFLQNFQNTFSLGDTYGTEDNCPLMRGVRYWKVVQNIKDKWMYVLRYAWERDKG